MSQHMFSMRDQIRARFGADLLAGKGVEIGAGAFPQALPPATTAFYYDVRSEAETSELFKSNDVVAPRPMHAIRTDFPNGADFLIAHNVLEHSPNPIAQLIEWNALVRIGGVVLVSFPHFEFCFDALRVVPNVSHLIDDYLNDVTGDDFSSGEHIFSFGLGWCADYARGRGDASLTTFCRDLLSEVRSSSKDLHWHALDTDLCRHIVAAAAIFGGSNIDVCRIWSPEAGQTNGDILIAYRVVNRARSKGEIDRLMEIDRAKKDAVRSLVQTIDEVLPAPKSGRRQWLLKRPYGREGRYCFTMKLPGEFVKSDGRKGIMEDNQELGPAESLHDDIRRFGRGRYSIWGDWIYFSSSDGTPCEENGRMYAVFADLT